VSKKRRNLGMENHKFKKGDTVIIRGPLVDWTEGPGVTPEMEGFVGETTKISKRRTSSGGATCYNLEVDMGEWMWAERWLKKIPQYGTPSHGLNILI
jgi:hypothetical protein